MYTHTYKNQSEKCSPHPGTTLSSFPIHPLTDKLDRVFLGKDSEIKFMISIKWGVEDIYFHTFIYIYKTIIKTLQNRWSNIYGALSLTLF